MLGTHGKRWLLASVLAIALVFPAGALAVRYLGPLNGGDNNAGIEIDFKLKNDKPHKVTQVEWHNVSQVVSCRSADVFFKTMLVQDGSFKGSGHPGEAGNPDWPPDKAIIETIKGDFRHHDKKIVGTLRIKGTPGGPCDGLDSGALPYVAK
jgi:hypothetical protein